MAIRNNFSYSTVATAPSPATSGTSLTVQSGDGSKFTRGPITIWPTSTQPTVANAEIAVVTGISTDTLTIVRAAQSSTAQSVTTGYQVAQTITAGIMQWYNVKDYGALGNGSTNDTTAIQNCINHALTEGLGASTVFFPAGDYRISTALTCTGASGTGGSGVILRGAGHDCTRITKAANINACTWNGSGGPASNPSQFGGMVDITVNGNGYTGACVQTNSAQQMFFRGCSFINNPDVTLDLNTVQDSYFSQCTFNNCGSTSKCVIEIYGSSGGTSNMLWFSQCRVETFLKGAVNITRGTGATGGGNNGFFFSQCKFENYPTVNGDIFSADGYTQQLVMDQIFISFGNYNTGYSTPANGIKFGDGSTASGNNQASFTNIFMNTGPTANIGNAVISVNGDSGNMNGQVTIRNVNCTATLATANVVVNGGHGFSFDIGQLNGGGTLIGGDGSYYNSSSSAWDTFVSGVALQGNLPAHTGAPALGGYYNGLGIGGLTSSGGNPIFGVLNSAQSGQGTGHTALTVLDTNVVETYNSTLDDGSGNMALGGVLKQRVNTLTASSNTYTPNIGTTDLALVSSPTAAFTIANPTGTAYDGQQLKLRIKSGTTGYAPSWGTAYKSSGVATLPSTALPASKTVTFGFIYDASATAWILLAADSTGY